MKVVRMFFFTATIACFIVTEWAAHAMSSSPIRVGVMRFESKIGNVSARQAGAITDIFTRMLSNSKSITVFERERLSAIAKEHKLNLSGLIDPKLAVQVGKLAGCQYILLGAVTQLEERESLSGKQDCKEKREAWATIDARIIDVSTSQIMFTFSESGRASQTSTGSGTSYLNQSSAMTVELGGLKSQAIDAAASNLGLKIREALGEKTNALAGRTEAKGAAPIAPKKAGPVRIGVMRFVSKADEVSDRQVLQVSDVFARVLSNSKFITLIERERLDVIAREHRLNLSGNIDPSTAIQVGKLAGCQYILLGSVTQITEKGASNRHKNSQVSFYEATASLEVRVVNVMTGEVILSLGKKGNSNASRSMDGHSGMQSEGESNLKERAITAAASQLGEKIRENLVGEYAAVIVVKGNEIRINRGEASGVNVGDIYRVYSDGKDASSIAIIEIRGVRDGLSIARIMHGNLDAIRRGDKLEAISLSEAEELAKRTRFPNQRLGG